VQPIKPVLKSFTQIQFLGSWVGEENGKLSKNRITVGHQLPNAFIRHPCSVCDARHMEMGR